MSARNVFVFCGDDCKSESMTKEQILSAIEQAVRTGEIKDVDAGFITTIREKNKNVNLSFWLGTSAEYNALTAKDESCIYILTDDMIGADIVALIAELKRDFEAYKIYMSKEIEEHYKNIVILCEALDKKIGQCEKDITTNKNNITKAQNDLDDIKLENTQEAARKNKTLWSGNLAFNTWVSSTEKINNINDYSIVKVRVPLDNDGTTDVLVLCTVCKFGASSLVITGTAPTNNDISGTLQQANVYIKCSTVGNITMQETKILHITASTQAIYERQITEIIGVM